MREQIAFVKTGWSDSYQGETVVGRHAYISKNEEAHERFNFLRSNDGRFYGCLPHIGHNQRPPQPTKAENWLVIFVAARNGNGPLTVVGWYDNATFERDYADRPEYNSANDFETDVNGINYVYCVSADDGHLIPAPDRNITVTGAHFKRAPIVYARGNGKNDDWRQKLAKLAENILESAVTSQPRGNPLLKFPDQEHRDKVEKESIQEAIKFLESKNYKVTDRQKDCCGYDLLAKRKRFPEELHVEVKGTSNEVMSFFMSRNEKQYMSNPKWRLLIVTNALKDPRASLMTEREVLQTFELNPFAWEALPK